MSLYQELGGAAAIEAALDLFYVKVMDDEKLRGFFDPKRIDALKSKQKAFLTMAFGGPNEYEGRDLRSAHAAARTNGLDATVFEKYMGLFRTTLRELGVPEEKIDVVMGIAYSGKSDVIGEQV